jgi:hypothetical protein
MTPPSCAVAGKLPLLALMLVTSIGTSRAWPPCPTIAGGIEILDPSVTLNVIRETDLLTDPSYCTPQSTSWECMGIVGSRVLNDGALGGLTIGVDAAGNHYNISARTSINFDATTSGFFLQRLDASGVAVDLLKMFTTITYPPSIYTDHFQYGSQFQFDVTNGKILFTSYHTQNYQSAGCPLPTTVGLIEISGLPKLFDTFVTFVPGGGAISVLTPALPDAFRTADSLQVWTGNVRSMPDWSQAQPLACMAAQSPTPGQLVSVPDTLPDPPVGQGRYYLVASQNGADRRLGRQYVNGAFSARQPAGLPECQ